MSNNATVWETSEPFEYKLLAGTWTQAENNLDSIFKPYSEFKSCGTNEDDLLDFNCDGTGPDGEFDFDVWYEDFSGPFYYATFWLLFAVIFTIVGIVWCVCNKCQCCCGGRNYNRKSDTYGLQNTDPEFETSSSGTKKKTLMVYVLGVLMAFWTIGYAYSTVIAIASNEEIRQAINDLPDDARKPLNDTETYINMTQAEIKYVFIDRFEEVAIEIRGLASLQERDGLSADTPQIKISNPDSLLDATDKLINELKRSKNEVHGNDGLTAKIDPVISKLESLVDFVASYNTSLYNDGGISAKQSNPQLEAAIALTREGLRGNANTLIDAIDDLQGSVSDIREDIDYAEENWLDIVRNSVYGTFMITNVIIILMFIGIVLGSVIVWFVDNDAKNTGFILLRFTITTMFSIGWIIVCMMLCGFALAGGFSQIFCEGVRELENGNGTTATGSANTRTAYYFQSFIPLQNNGGDGDNYVLPSYSYVVRNLKEGKSAYIAFDLHQVYNVEEASKISDNFKDIIGTEFQKSANQAEADFTFQQSTLDEIQRLMPEMSSLRDFGWITKLFNKIENEFSMLAKNAKDNQTKLMAIKRQASDEIIRVVDIYERFIYTELTENVGGTRPLYDALQYGIDVVCYKALVPVATYWWGFQFLLIMFVAFMITALLTERSFK